MYIYVCVYICIYVYTYIYICIYIYIYKFDLCCQQSQVKCATLWTGQLYTYEGYQQQPVAITQCFMDWTQSSDGCTIQYLSVLKTKIYESWLQCSTNSKHEHYIFTFSIHIYYS